jgi:HK97 family phage portal protein
VRGGLVGGYAEASSVRLADYVRGALRTWRGPWFSDDKELVRYYGGGAKNSAGVPVNEQTALTYAAFWAAVSIISSDVASLPLILYKRGQQGGKERHTSHKLYKILHDEPNPEMSSVTFRETLQGHALTWGNGYAEIQRDGANGVKALWPITPDRVTVFRDERTLEVRYRVARAGGGEVEIPARDMLHVPGFGFDGLTGYSVVGTARESLGLGIATERFGATFFGNGSTFGGVLQHPQVLGAEGAKSLRDSIAGMHQGVERSHKFLVLEEGMTYQRLGIPPNDAQFLETRKFQIAEIARWFQIPPHKLGDLERATFSNIEEQNLDYYTATLRKWLVRWEQEINRKLISPLERNIQFAEHMIDGLLRGDIARRYSAYATGRQWGWLSVDDIRERENMNPLDDGSGKSYLVPSNMMPADRINEVIDAQVREPEPPPAPVAPPAKESDEDEGERAALHAQITAQAETIRAFADKMEAAAVREAESAATAATLRQDFTQSEQGRKDAGAQILELQGNVAALVEKLGDVVRSRDAANQQVDDLRAVANQHELRAVKAEATIAEIEMERDDLAARAHNMGIANEFISKRITVLEADLSGAQEQSDSLQAAVNQQEQRAVKAEAQMIEHAATIQQMGDHAEYQAQRMAALEADLAEARDRHESDAIEIGDANAKCALAITAQVAADKRAGEAESAMIEARETLASAQRAVEDANAQLSSRVDAEAQRTTAMLTIQRAMAADVVRKLVDVECTRARRHQADKRKFGSWVDQYYATSEDVFYDALLPIARLHAACVGGIDPEVQARELARAHVEESQAQLRAVLESEDFHEDLDRTLRRWEVVRHEDTADKLLRDGIASVRAL